MKNIPMVLKVAAVAVIFFLMGAMSASAEHYNSARGADGKFIYFAKDGTMGAGEGNAATPGDAQRGAGSAEGYTSLSICFAPALEYGNILVLAPHRTFTSCLHGSHQVSPPNRGGLPSRDSSSQSPIDWLLDPVRELAGGK